MKLATITLCLSLLIPTPSLAWSLGKPDLSLVTRPSIVGKGRVLIVTNTSDEYLHECTIKINSSDKTPVIATTLAPHASTEIGWLELDQELRPGDKVAIGCKGFLMDANVVLP
ncbi:MAG: hypothetical protein ACRERU_20405 [Methylococcales bacterium]